MFVPLSRFEIHTKGQPLKCNISVILKNMLGTEVFVSHRLRTR